MTRTHTCINPLQTAINCPKDCTLKTQLKIYRQKLTAKVKETEEALEDLQNKYSTLDKTKARIAAELEDLNLDIEKVLVEYKA